MSQFHRLPASLQRYNITWGLVVHDLPTNFT
uniref:Uncharacterized protein n=1 Tax=Setaria viridis TaxID=4556 RepID=A0A4U6VI89_SETVI|nr:hypothetical protein SEVIR_3G319003v2 [Setaria viridis]